MKEPRDEPRIGRWTGLGLKIGLIVVLAGCAFLYWSYGQYRVTPISPGKFFHSSAMPPEELRKVVEKHGIKTVVDLRFLTGKTQEEQDAMALAGVNYQALPTPQIPTDETIDAFLAIVSDPANYPVLVHCHHGEGRAPLFGAIYRIEREGWSPEEARRHAKALSFRGDFAPDGRKGKFLQNYQPRRESE